VRAALAFLLVASGVGCRAPEPCRLAADRESRVPWVGFVTDLGEISAPAGWQVSVRDSPEPVFDLYTANRELTVEVAILRAPDPEMSLREALQRHLDGYARVVLTVNTQFDGWEITGRRGARPMYDEAMYEVGRLFAACALDYDATVALVAVIREANSRSVSRRRYDEAGGREMLCRIAASVRRLRLAR
jgi:hypothetical protein